MTDEIQTPAPAAQPAASPAPSQAVAEPNTQPAASAPASSEPKPFSVPDAYKDRGWASKIKTEDDVYKQIDNLQSLVGRKAIAPDLSKATPEEKEEHYATLRPTDKAAYKFDEGTPDYYRDAFYKVGLTAEQANELIQDVKGKQEAEFATMKDPAKFDESLKTAFGDAWETKNKEIFAFMQQSPLTEAEKGMFDQLANDTQLINYKIANYAMEQIAKVKEEYGAKESGSQGENDSTPVKEDLDAKANSLLDQIFAAEAKRPPVFEEITKLKTEYDAIQSKRASRNNQQQ